MAEKPSVDFEAMARAIVDAAKISHDEASLREKVQPLLEEFLKVSGSDLALRHMQHERHLANGRSDTVFNRLVIEYKRPNSFGTKRQTSQVLTQMRIYLEDLAKEERWKKERLLAVAFDGCHFLYYKYLGRWIPSDPVPVSTQSVEEFCRYLIKLTDKAALIPENLIRDFAIGQESRNYLAINAIKSFYNALRGDHSERTKALYEQWVVQFSEVHGAFEGNRRFDTEMLRRSYGFSKNDQVDLLPFFFALETYFTLLMKLLAYQVVGYYLDRTMGLPLAEWENFGSEKLCEEMANLDNGGIFRDRKIRNFIEGDFFGWYLSDWNKDIEDAVRKIIKRLNEYDPESLEIEPEYTRDLLKQLYQYLIPPQIRHDLGEYYTPDWLAESVLNRLDYGPKRKDLIDLRILDPGCGSGTFVVLAIKRAIAHTKLYNLRPEEALKKILANIHGFDLNPLAVIAARTNYLLALAELLPFKNKLPGGELRIPIYLCDSINPPKAETEDKGTFFEGEPSYSFRTSVGTFTFAAPIVKKQRIVQLTPLLEECVRKNIGIDKFIKRVKEELDFVQQEWTASESALRDTYTKLENFEKKQVNGIWANIIKNAFAPLFVGQFDLIAGNPPWVNWEALPQHYRDVTQQLWVNYGLFSLKGHAARLGGGKKDLSMLFSYVAIDKYLKNSGRLAFVITQTVFKTQGAGDGFRRFTLGKNGLCFGVEQVDDMVELQPFEAATNHTAIFSCKKGEKTKYPLPYILWRKKLSGAIDSKFSFEEVFNITQRYDLRAQPVDNENASPWMSARPLALKAIQKALGASAYRAREGANSGGANGVYWINIADKKGNLIEIENLASVGKKKVKEVRCEIETKLVFQLLRGRDIKRWSATSSAYQIVAQNPETRKGYSDEWMKENAPKTREYFYQFEQMLRNRSAFKKYQSGAEFWSQYNVGPYTFAPYKVVWPWISTKLTAAVIGIDGNGKPVIPEHNTSFVAFESDLESHFFCAYLNSLPANFIAVTSYSGGGGGIASPSVLERICIPRFDPENEIHMTLANLSKQCHMKMNTGVSISDLEERIDDLAAQLWGLTDQEMKDIRESLTILNPPCRSREKNNSEEAKEETLEEKELQ